MSRTIRLDEERARRLKRSFQSIARAVRQQGDGVGDAPSRSVKPTAWMIYAHADQVAAAGLIGRLRGDGIAATWDRDLPPGVPYDLHIESSIRTCDKAVVLWSEHAMASRFVHDEATLALELEKLVPVHLADFRPSMLTMRFRRLQSISVENYPVLVGTLRGRTAGGT